MVDKSLGLGLVSCEQVYLIQYPKQHIASSRHLVNHALPLLSALCNHHAIAKTQHILEVVDNPHRFLADLLGHGGADSGLYLGLAFRLRLLTRLLGGKLVGGSRGLLACGTGVTLHLSYLLALVKYGLVQFLPEHARLRGASEHVHLLRCGCGFRLRKSLTFTLQRIFRVFCGTVKVGHLLLGDFGHEGRHIYPRPLAHSRAFSRRFNTASCRACWSLRSFRLWGCFVNLPGVFVSLFICQ